MYLKLAIGIVFIVAGILTTLYTVRNYRRNPGAALLNILADMALGNTLTLVGGLASILLGLGIVIVAFVY